MTDDSYHMPICIGIGIGISISKIFGSVLGIESIGKKWYRSTFTFCICIWGRAALSATCSKLLDTKYDFYGFSDDLRDTMN